MRQINFRAWDRLEGEMYEVYALDWGRAGDIVSAGLLSMDGGKQRKVYPNKVYGDKIVFLEDTSLSDKNGIAIYEGDKATDVNDDFYEVKFDEGKFIALMNDNVIVDLSEVAADIEVVGNIYENKELLK